MDLDLHMENACSIVAMRDLLDDPNWGPEEFCLMIYFDNGLLGEHTKLLEQYAPVKVWLGADSGISGDENSAEIYDGGASQVLPGDAKMIVSYATSEGRAHMECILVKDMGKYADRVMLGMVTLAP